jgi:hypothetical protein
MKKTRSRLEEYERQVADVKVETKHTAGQVQVLRRMLGASVNHTGAVAQVRHIGLPCSSTGLADMTGGDDVLRLQS